jgi:hypothetical protein
VWRPKALHPAAFLIDQDRRIEVTRRPAHFLHKSSDLGRIINVALEEDETPRPLGAQKCALLSGQLQSRYTGYECACAHGAD